MKFLLDKPRRFAYNPLTEKPVSGRAQVAQSVEQTIENRRVAGSIPALGTIFLFIKIRRRSQMALNPL